jgi:hypothetical protein
MHDEMRTPMNCVPEFANLLPDTPLEAEQRKFVGTIQRSRHALLTVTSEALGHLNIEAGRRAEGASDAGDGRVRRDALQRSIVPAAGRCAGPEGGRRDESGIGFGLSCKLCVYMCVRPAHAPDPPAELRVPQGSARV